MGFSSKRAEALGDPVEMTAFWPRAPSVDWSASKPLLLSVKMLSAALDPKPTPGIISVYNREPIESGYSKTSSKELLTLQQRIAKVKSSSGDGLDFAEDWRSATA